MLTLDQLEVFEAILRTGGFAAAARDLGRAPSGVSYAVKSLESTLGLTLFDRSHSRATLTLQGKRVEQEARQILDRSYQLHSVAKQLQEGWEPRLEIVADGILPLPPLMRALRRFSEERVPTQVKLQVEYLGGVEERFHRDGADLMLVLDFKNDGTLQSNPLPGIELVLVAHRDHELNQLQTEVTRPMLKANTELIVADSGTSPKNRPQGLRFFSGTSFALSDFQSKREAILEGVGFGWLPMHLAAEHLRSQELKRINFEEESKYHFTPFLVRRRQSAPGKGASLLSTLILEEQKEFNYKQD
jgi:DNA-binding transcriptional LysR family regulator